MSIALTEEEKSQLDWYLQNGISYFLKDFFSAGNWDFYMDVHPHNCQSGLWFTATWIDKGGRQRRAAAMGMKLMWERVIKEHFAQQREEKYPLTE